MASLIQACQPGIFSPTLPGAEILSVQANLVTNYSSYIPGELRYTQPTINVVNASFCNITVTYTHDGIGDSINIEAWFPVTDWNERFLAVGGSGYVAGRTYLSYADMLGSLAEGYATITTDAGVGTAEDPGDWVLISPGVVNWVGLENLGYVSLGDEAIIGKSLVESYYGKPAKYSYWNGCSQGGRQGYALAQIYPEAYDGIAASAPAINTPELAGNMYWPQQYMNDIKKYPYGCEIDVIVTAAIAACDGIDGVVDGLVGNPEACFQRFNPFSIVGKRINCTQTGTFITVSEAAALVVKASWRGISTSSGWPLWYGYRPGADLTGDFPGLFGSDSGIAATSCSNGMCVGAPISLGSQWVLYFLLKDKNGNLTTITQDQYLELYTKSIEEYGPLWNTNNPDLSAFSMVGGKMVTYHGLADQLIPDQGTRNYYDAVKQRLPNVTDFYRYFPIPGLGHCFGGNGGQPYGLFDQLREWVENGTAPASITVTATNSQGESVPRMVCPYPSESVYQSSCGDINDLSCYKCL